MKKASAAVVAAMVMLSAAQARDDGRYAQSPLKPWFDQLSSGNGRCCSDADGRAVKDPDWGIGAKGYWVIVDGERLEVPPNALVKERNRFGRAVVWPYTDGAGARHVRCFLPGAET